MLRPAAARTWDQLSRRRRHEHERHRLRPGVRGGGGRAGRGRVTTAAGASAPAIEAVARDLARQQAADGEGATTLITAAVTGARDDADARAVARAVVSSQPGQGRGPRPRPELGPDRGRRRATPGWPTRPCSRRPACPPADATARAGTPAVLDPGPAPDRDRRSPRVRRRAPAARSRSIARRPAPRWTRRSVILGLDLGLGDGRGEAFGCDLTEKYVIENSEYTT